MRDDGEPVEAIQKVLHDVAHPSHIILPIIPSGTVQPIANELKSNDL